MIDNRADGRHCVNRRACFLGFFVLIRVISSFEIVPLNIIRQRLKFFSVARSVDNRDLSLCNLCGSLW